MRVRVNKCGRKIRNANRMPKNDDKTKSNLRKKRREEGKKEDKKKKTRKKKEGKKWREKK